MKLREAISIWVVRFLLAALFIFGSEVLLWTHFQQYTAADWAVRVVGYLTLSVFVLDMAARFRIRDIYDSMTLLAMYGLLASLLITPTISYAFFPESLLTRVLGGHTLLGFEMWGLFLVLTAGQNRRYRLLLWAVAAWLGVYWGVWMRWMPEFGNLFEATSLETMFAVAGGGFAVVMLLYGLSAAISRQQKALDFRLSLLQWLFLLLVLSGLFLYQAATTIILEGAIVVVLLLLGICWTILWYRREDKGDTLLDAHLPMTPLSPLWIAPAVGLFIATTLFAYHLPLIEIPNFNQLILMEIGFGAAGTAWLPLISTVLAMRGIDHQMRTRQII